MVQTPGDTICVSKGICHVDLIRTHLQKHYHHQTSIMRGTKFHNLNVSRLILQLSLPNPLKLGIKSRMKI